MQFRFKKAVIAGFVLTEVCVALAVLMVLAATAMGVYNEVTRRFQLRATKDALLATLRFGRAQAVHLNSPVVVCKSPVPVATERQCASNGDWTQGWMVFEDRNSNRQHDPGEPILQHAVAQPASVRIWTHAAVQNGVYFSPRGPARSPTNAFQLGSFFICNRSTEPQQVFRLLLRRTGQARSAMETHSAC